MLYENCDKRFTKPILQSALQGAAAAGLVGQAVFSFDRFSILGPGQWQDSTDEGQAQCSNRGTVGGTIKDEVACM